MGSTRAGGGPPRVGVEIGWVIDIPRDLEMPDETVTIDYLESALTPAGLVAIGLGGYEVGFPAAPYAPHFERARAIGLPSVPHAGETEGADSVREAVELLACRADRAWSALPGGSPLVDSIVERGIMLEVCPTSNVLLRVVDSIDDHPLACAACGGRAGVPQHRRPGLVRHRPGHGTGDRQRSISA